VRVNSDVSIGRAPVFGRLRRELGVAEVIGKILAHRHFSYKVERAILLTVLHRLMDPGSDRAAEKWKQDFRIEGAQGISEADGVGAALDEQARPVACALLPGYATGVKLFLPAIKGLQSRFEAGSFCVVADRRMVSLATVQALEAPGSGIEYILGCRMRGNKEVRDEVLGVDEDLVQEVAFERQASRDPLVLQLKEVHIADPR
jgi:hypothetical protein